MFILQYKTELEDTSKYWSCQCCWLVLFSCAIRAKKCVRQNRLVRGSSYRPCLRSINPFFKSPLLLSFPLDPFSPLLLLLLLLLSPLVKENNSGIDGLSMAGWLKA